MRIALALLLVLGIAALAWVTFFGGGGDAADRPEDPEPVRESGTDVRESVRTGSDSPVRVVEPEPAEEIPPYPWVEPEWKAAMAKALSRVKVRLDVRRGKLDEVLRQLEAQLGQGIDASALPAEAWEHDFKLSFRDADPMFVLREVARIVSADAWLRPTGIRFFPAGVSPSWEGNEVYTAGLLRAFSVLEAGGPKAVPVTKLLPVDFQDVTLQQALTEIGHRLGAEVDLDSRVTLERRVGRLTLRTERMTGAQILDDVTAAARLAWAADELGIVVTFEDRARAIRDERERAKANVAKQVELAAKDRPLASVAEEIRRQVGVPVVVDRALWEPKHPRITLRAGPEPLRKLIRRLADAIPARFLVRGEAIYLIPPAKR